MLNSKRWGGNCQEEGKNPCCATPSPQRGLCQLGGQEGSIASTAIPELFPWLRCFFLKVGPTLGEPSTVFASC